MKLNLILLIAIGLVSCVQPQENNKTPTAQINSDQNIMPMAQRIKIDELQNALTNLQQGKTEFEFIGITSNGIDCIYFVYEKGKFNFEYEAMVQSQIPYIEKIKDFALTNNYKSIMTTYNNQPQYQSDKPAPVIRIETNCSLEEATKLGEKIQADIFKNNSATVYDIVP